MAEIGAALKAVAQENAQLKLRLAKYEDQDLGLYSCSQLSEDQPASQDEHGPLGDPTNLPPSQMIEMLEEFEAHSSPMEPISIRVAAILSNGAVASTVTLERGETLSAAASRSAAQEPVAAAAAGPLCDSKWRWRRRPSVGAGGLSPRDATDGDTFELAGPSAGEGPGRLN